MTQVKLMNVQEIVVRPLEAIELSHLDSNISELLKNNEQAHINGSLVLSLPSMIVPSRDCYDSKDSNSNLSALLKNAEMGNIPKRNGSKGNL